MQQTFIPDPRYCYRKEIIGGNNTSFKFVDIKHGPDDIFCILVDNQEENRRFIEREATANISEFQKLTTRHRGFVWPDVYRDSVLREIGSEAEKSKGLKNRGKNTMSRIKH